MPLRTHRTLGGLGVQGPEEAVLNLRTQGRLEQTHHFILCFRSSLSLDMFVWSSYECHLISWPVDTRDKVCKKIRNCLLIWLFNEIELFVSAPYMYSSAKCVVCLTSFDSHWNLTALSEISLDIFNLRVK